MCSTVYCLRLPIFACYSWEMALSVVFHESFDDIQDRKGMREKSSELDSLKAYTTCSIRKRLPADGSKSVALINFKFLGKRRA
jgi:hypothetical protein